MEQFHQDNYKTEKEENTKEKLPIKEGVDFVFDQNPQLTTIGTKEEYSKYLDTIFPNSTIKDIVYHGGPEGIDSFDKNAPSFDNIEKQSRGRFFTGILGVAQVYAQKAQITRNSSKVYAAILNVIQPVTVNSGEFLDEKLYPNNDSMIYESFLETNQVEEVAVFEPEQIYVLGSHDDLEKFTEFVKSIKTETDSLA